MPAKYLQRSRITHLSSITEASDKEVLRFAEISGMHTQSTGQEGALQEQQKQAPENQTGKSPFNSADFHRVSDPPAK
jgi:hypothetical protein